MPARMRPHAKHVWDVIDEGMAIRMHSSNLLAIEYDEEERELTVEFVSGPIYEYYGVPPSKIEGLVTAPSTGTYFHQNIRFSYPYARVSD